MAGKPFSRARSLQRLLSKIEIDPRESCWIWTGSMNANGYGEVRVAGKLIGAHRRSWELHNGPIPDSTSYHGVCVCHRCDTPACVNPAHLFLGSHRDNMRDRQSKGRAAMPTGDASPVAKLTKSSVAEIRRLGAQGVSQRALARRFHISQPHVGRLLRRESWPLNFIEGRMADLWIGMAKPKRARKIKEAA